MAEGLVHPPGQESELPRQGQAQYRRDLLARDSRRRRAFGRLRDRQGRRAAGRLGGKFRRAAPEQAQEHLRHRRRLGVLQPAFLALAQQPLGPDREQEIPSGADVCDRSQHGQGRGLERPRQGRDRPVGLGDQVLHRRGAEIRLRSGQGQGAAQGSRLQRREAPHAASALWRDVAALGRNGQARTCRTSASTSR